MMLKRWIILPLMFLPVLCAGKSEYILSGILSETDGLSSNAVNCILQDSRGFLWFGTQSGLDLWDGHSIETFHPGKGTADYRVPLDGVLCLQDIDGSVWAGTETGLYIYDESEKHFSPSSCLTQYGVNIASRVTGICRGDAGRVWIGTGGQGVFILDTVTGGMVQHSRQFPFVDALCRGNDGRIWTVIAGELWYFSPTGEQYRRIEGPGGIRCLMFKEGDLWFGGTGGLSVLHPTDGSISSLPEVKGPVTALGTDASGHLLAAGESGLWRIFSDGRSASLLRPVANAAELRNPAISAITVDREGTLWMATHSSGILHVSVKQSGIDYIPLPDGSAPARRVLIAEDGDGRIFIAAGRTLWSMARATGALTVCPEVHPSGEISAIKADRDALWIGTVGDGLYLYRPGKQALRHYGFSESVQVIHLRKDGSLILGTDKGVFSHYKDGDFFTAELDRRNINILLNGSQPEDVSMTEFKAVTQSSVTAICEDAGDRLYIATGNRGVFRKDFKDGSWYHFISTDLESSIPWNRITTLFCDRDGTVWAGTAGAGLWRLPAGGSVFTAYPMNYPKLEESDIFCLQQDADGHLWLNTSMGISRLDPQDGSISTHLSSDYSFPSGPFGSSSSLKAADGKLFFGYGQGIVSFFPHSGKANQARPSVCLRHMYVNGKEVGLPGEGRIQLDWKDNNFSLEFAALSFTNPQKNLYSWRLRGLDRNWTTPSAVNTTSYTKVPPGTYVFELRGSNDDALFSEAREVLTISVRPPWWRSSTAYFIYILAALLAVGSAIVLWHRRIKRKYSEMMKREQEEREKDLYKQRIRFFLGLVHEIRTPLTLIRLQSEKPDGGDAGTIRRNLDYMQDTVNKILTFDKQSSNGVEMLLTQVDLRELAQSTLSEFAPAAREKGITLSSGLPEMPVRVLADEDMVHKIITNLLGNAIKYARHTIRLTVNVSGKNAILEVSDDGPGVRKSQREKIFGMFYTDPEDKVAAASGIGVGLAYARQLAEAHKGTLTVEDTVPHGATFVLQLPLMEDQGAGVQQSEESLAGTGSPACILVVEDNSELLATLKAELGQWYTVHTAADGRQALKVLEKENIDVIISDMMMPVMDGLELCRRVKGSLDYCHIPFILLTAKVSLDAKGEGMDSGADAYIEKPFSLRQLCGQVNNLLRLRQAWHEAFSQGKAHPESLLKAPEADFINAINAAIEKQLSEENFSIETLASEMAMSRTNFFRKFRAITGTTPNDYLKNYRLDRAAQMILEGARINEAAESTGFFSSSYFAKCFRARFGVLPKDYRK